jgi:hypothetical protein
MKEKLVRNSSDERWRAYWKAVDAAASNAPTLRYQEKKTQREERQRTSTPRSTKQRKRR